MHIRRNEQGIFRCNCVTDLYERKKKKQTLLIPYANIFVSRDGQRVIPGDHDATDSCLVLVRTLSTLRVCSCPCVSSRMRVKKRSSTATEGTIKENRLVKLDATSTFSDYITVQNHDKQSPTVTKL